VSSPFPHPLAGRALSALAVVGVCVGGGWAIARGGAAALLVLSLPAAVALMLVVGELRLSALWVWAPLSVIAFPLAGQLPGKPFVTFDRVWIVAMVALLVVMPAARPRARATRFLLIALATLATVYATRALLTEEDRLHAVRQAVDALVLPLILFEIVRRVAGYGQRYTERMAFTMTLAGVLLAVIGIGQDIFGYELATLSGSKPFFDEAIGQVRISGPYDVPEPYALSVILCLGASLYWMYARGRGAYLFGGVAVGLELTAIGLTFFRVAWLGAIVVLLFAVGLRPRRYARALGVVGLAAVLLALAFTGVERISAVKTRINNSKNVYTRLATYEQGVEIFTSRPVFGVGIDRYHAISLETPSSTVAGVSNEPSAHSSYMATLAEVGLVGLAPLLLLTAAVWRLLRAARRRLTSRPDAVLAASVTGAAIAYLMFSLTLTMIAYGSPNAFFAVLLGLVAGRLDSAEAARRRGGREPAREPREGQVAAAGRVRPLAPVG
jgi:O-antigen ligase